jgi:hypothetical protein
MQRECGHERCMPVTCYTACQCCCSWRRGCGETQPQRHLNATTAYLGGYCWRPDDNHGTHVRVEGERRKHDTKPIHGIAESITDGQLRNSLRALACSKRPAGQHEAMEVQLARQLCGCHTPQTMSHSASRVQATLQWLLAARRTSQSPLVWSRVVS